VKNYSLLASIIVMIIHLTERGSEDVPDQVARELVVG